MGCLKRLVGCVFTLIIIIALILAVLYFWMLPSITTKIEDGLRRKLMLGPSATVEITDTGLIALSQGRIERVSVSSPEARVNNYVVKNLRFEAEGLTFDLVKTAFLGDPVILSLGEGELEFDVEVVALQQAWESAAAKIGISDLVLTLVPEDASIKLEGVWKISWLKKEYPFEATGKLALQGPSLLFFEFPEIKVGNLSIGISRLRDALVKVSPRINLGDYKVKLTLEDISFSSHGLHIRARAESDDGESGL